VAEICGQTGRVLFRKPNGFARCCPAVPTGQKICKIWTLRASHEVGHVLRFCAEDQIIAPRYSFYM